MEEYTNKILNKEKELCKEIQRLNIELDDMQHDYEKSVIINRELKYENTQIINELNDLKNKYEDRENKFKEISKSEIWKQMNEYKTKNEELENKLKYYINNIKYPTDEHIADIIRKNEKPKIIAVNKAEGILDEKAFEIGRASCRERV